MTLKGIIRMAEQVACGSAVETQQAANAFYLQAKMALDKAEQAWVKARQLQYALYDLEAQREETP